MTSFRDKALLVRLTLSSWSARKFDRKVSDEVAANHNADRDAGRYNKLLVGKDALTEIQRIDGAIRTYHYFNTLPWSDEGARILPSANYFSYTAKLRGFKSERKDRVREFVASYPRLVEAAKRRLNGMYRDADYPAANTISQRFAFDVSLQPIPEPTGFAAELFNGDEEERAKVVEDTEERLNAAFDLAVRDQWQRIHDSVSHIAERLKVYAVDEDEDNGKKGGKGGKGGKVRNPFRDSLIGNVRELVEVLPKLNFTSDRKLDQTVKRLRDTVAIHEPDDLRSDGQLRKKVRKSAEQILKDMKSYVGEVSA